MTVMNTELYRALKEAGASEETASKAAESVAEFDKHFADIRSDIAGVKGELKLVKWMAGISLGGLLAIVGILINLSLQVGRLTEAIARIAT